jgi:hypothetical protein
MTYLDAALPASQVMAERDNSSTRTCVHHWLIEAPAGATSLGTCTRCGGTREFSNGLEFSAGEREAPAPSEFQRALRAAVRWDPALSDERI